MPIADIKCEECGNIFEEYYSGAHPLPTNCKFCNSENIHKLFPTKVHCRVELGKQEKYDKMISDRKEAAKEVSKDENLKANIAGEQNYQQQSQWESKLSSDFKNF